MTAALTAVGDGDLGVGRSEARVVPVLAGYHGEQHHIPRGQEGHGLLDGSTLPGGRDMCFWMLFVYHLSGTLVLENWFGELI